LENLLDVTGEIDMTIEEQELFIQERYADANCVPELSYLSKQKTLTKEAI
jgi:hypothetical protein